MTEKLKDIKDVFVNFKTGTISAIIISVVVATFGFGMIYQRIQGRLNHLDAKTDVYNERWTAVEERVSAQDIKYMEIQTTLKNVEVLVLEIKNDLKSK